MQVSKLAGVSDFRRLWIGQAISRFGSTATLVAMPLLILATTGSAEGTGLVTFLEGISAVIVMLPAGALADRLDRRVLMVAYELLSTVSVGSLWMAVTLHYTPVWLIALTASAAGMCAGGFNAAASAVLPQLVPEDQLADAMGLLQARNSVIYLLGPIAGGFLFAIDPALPFAVDSVSFLLSALLLSRVRTPVRIAAETTSFFSDMFTGVGFIVRHPLLRFTGIAASGINMLFAGLLIAVIALAKEHGVSDGVVGSLYAASALGSLVGALFAPALARRLSLKQVLVGLLSVLAVLIPLIGLIPRALVVLAVMAAVSALAPALNVLLVSAQFEHTPDRLQGRVQSSMALFATVSGPLGPLAAGAGFEHLGAVPTFALIAGVFALLAASSATSRALRPSGPTQTTGPTQATRPTQPARTGDDEAPVLEAVAG